MSSNTNAETVLYIYLTITIILDGLVYLTLSYIATTGPKSTIAKPDELNESLKTRLYIYLFEAEYPIITNQDIKQAKNKEMQKKSSSNNNYFSDNSLFDYVCAQCTCFKYLKFSMQLWAFCCGFLSIYLSLVFWLNLFVEYTLASIGRSDRECLIALIAVYFLIELIFWFLKRQFEALILITRNVGDRFNCRIILFWRLFDFAFSIIMAGSIMVDSSTWIFQWWMLIMVIRGLVWQIWNIVIVFFGTISVVIYKLIRDGNNWINIKEFIFVITNKPESMNECNWYKYVYVVLIWIFIVLMFGMTPVYAELFVFGAVIMIIYYLIILFDIGKYQAFFALLYGKYHAQYFGYANKESQAISELNTEMLVVSNKYQPISHDPDDDDDDDKQQEQLQTTDAHVDSDVNNNNDKDDQDNIIDDGKMIIMDFWDRIPYAHAAYMCYCCYCYCSCAKNQLREGCILCARGLIKWICIIIVVFAIFLTVGLWLKPESKSVHNPPQYEGEHVAPYGICSAKWADYINIVDLIYMVKSSSFLSWDGEIDEEELFIQLRLWFGESEVSGWDEDSLYLHYEPGFFFLKNSKWNFDMLINRPTNTNMDTIQDIRLWGEACLFHMFSLFIPLSDMLPLSFIRSFVSFASIPENLLSPSIHSNYDDPVYDFILEEADLSNSSEYFFMGGHSLGAGLTDIVSGRLYHDGFADRFTNHTLVSFSLGSPGTVWSSKKFGYDVEDIDKATSIHLKARRDLVSALIDIHGGVEQTVRCVQPKPLDCHASTNYFCEMYRSCGASLFRNMSFTKCVCEEKFDFKYCW